MPNKFPDLVNATIVRMRDKDEMIFVQKKTEIHFGLSHEIIGAAFLTSPNMLEFSKTPKWREFKLGEPGNWKDDQFESVGAPDSTLRNIISVVREGYHRAGLGEPRGKVSVYYLSNAVRPKGTLEEKHHDRVYSVIEANPSRSFIELIDPVVMEEYLFLEACKAKKFIILGFIDNKVFEDRYKKITAWADKLSNMVATVDGEGCYADPRKWNTEKYLREMAIQGLTQVLKNNTVED